MKIGLVAMSGVRACDEELLAVGLNLPGFVERSRTIASLPSLGLLTLAGMTPAQHQVDYFEIEDIRKQTTFPTGYDLIAISSFTAQINEAYELARYYRGTRTATVIGGLHVSMLPEEALEYCDAVVVGEGECVWPELLSDLEVGDLKRRYGDLNGSFDLKDAPMPAYHLLDIEKYNRLTVQTSRGCPHRCDFCASSILITDKYKQKPIEKVLAEIDAIQKIWKHPFIEFADDNSFVNKRYWKDLLPRLAKRKVRWFAETDLSVAEDPELLERMRDSGCAQVLIGFESPSEEGLTGIETKRNWKQRQLPRYKEAIQTIQSHGITVNGCFILGLDGHTVSIFDDVYAFVVETELYEVQITVLTPFPGTPLYSRLLKEGRILEPGNWKKCTLFDINYKPLNMSVSDLHSGLIDLAVRLYSEDFTAWRRSRFKKHLKSKLIPRSAAI
jgi:radical SAM superfamily enzyme YgiQ (UPF0313 family)